MSTELLILLWVLSIPCAYTLGFVTGVRAIGVRFKALLSNEQLLADMDKLERGQAKACAKNGGKR